MSAAAGRVLAGPHRPGRVWTDVSRTAPTRMGRRRRGTMLPNRTAPADSVGGRALFARWPAWAARESSVGSRGRGGRRNAVPRAAEDPGSGSPPVGGDVLNRTASACSLGGWSRPPARWSVWVGGPPGRPGSASPPVASRAGLPGSARSGSGHLAPSACRPTVSVGPGPRGRRQSWASSVRRTAEGPDPRRRGRGLPIKTPVSRETVRTPSGSRTHAQSLGGEATGPHRMVGWPITGARQASPADASTAPSGAGSRDPKVPGARDATGQRRPPTRGAQRVRRPTGRWVLLGSRPPLAAPASRLHRPRAYQLPAPPMPTSPEPPTLAPTPPMRALPTAPTRRPPVPVPVVPVVEIRPTPASSWTHRSPGSWSTRSPTCGYG